MVHIVGYGSINPFAYEVVVEVFRIKLIPKVSVNIIDELQEKEYNKCFSLYGDSKGNDWDDCCFAKGFQRVKSIGSPWAGVSAFMMY